MRLNPLVAKYFPSEQPETDHSGYNEEEAYHESIVPSSWNGYDDDEDCDCDYDDYDDEDDWDDEDNYDDSEWF